MTAASRSSAERFDKIRDALLATEEGRWFYAALLARLQSQDTDRLLAAIAEAKDAILERSEDTRGQIFHAELAEMARTIQRARVEISQIRMDDAPPSRIIAATEELDAIVTATERATSDILSASERIQAAADKLRKAGAQAELCDEIDAQSTEIMMACSFQDITGQRTTKVVNLLRYLEQRVNSMLAVWGQTKGAGASDLARADFNPLDTRPDAHLMTGPAREGEGVSQDQVDRMLGGGAEEMAEEVAPPASGAGEPEPKARSQVPAAPAPAEPAAPEAPAEGEALNQDDIANLFAA
ncbi:MAG: protein phosphatase CheZ [Alphaproteobacteria bacterium]|nr:protein phosphatase CheZ [Alphaproteobacteria bacterium]